MFSRFKKVTSASKCRDNEAGAKKLAMAARSALEPLEARRMLSGTSFSPAVAGTASIGGIVYNDANGNGTVDGEKGLAGRQVYLDLQGVDTLVAGDPVATTDANGNYSFGNLAAGNYLVRLVPQSGHVTTLPIWGGKYFVQLGNGQAVGGENFLDAPVTTPSVKLANGQLLVADMGQRAAAISRFNADSSVDTAYGNLGVMTIPGATGIATSMTTQPDGRIAVVFPNTTVMLTSTGAIDSSGPGPVTVAAPTGLTATASSSSLVHLSFTDNSNNETSFAVERSASASGPWTSVGTVAGTTTTGARTFDDNSVSAGTTYFYRVYGVNGSATSAVAGPASVTTPGTVVTSGATITGTFYNDANSNGVRDAGEAGVVGRQVYLDLQGLDRFVSGDPQTTTDASGKYTFTGLAGGNYLVRPLPVAGQVTTSPVYGGKYFIQLASNQTVSGEDFGNLTVTTPSFTISNQLLVSGTASNGQATVSRYNADGSVDVPFGTYGLVTLPAVVTGQPTSATAQGTSTVITYPTQTVTLNGSGGIVSIVANGGTTPTINAPTALTVTAASPTSVSISFTDNATNEQSYAVERSSSASGPWTSVATVAGTTTTGNATATDSTVAANTTYFYRVYGVSGSVQSPIAGPVSVTTPNVATTGGKITGTVYYDTNKDGSRQAGETGIAGRQLYLDLQGIGSQVSSDPVATTDGSGNYTFAGLPSANYIVRLVAQTGDTLTYPYPQYGASYFIPLGSNQTVSGKDFGLVPPTNPVLPSNWVPYATMLGQDTAAKNFPTLNGAGIGVAIIDRGIDYNSQYIGASKIVAGYNFRDNNTNVLDDYGHGTGVAGIVAGNGFTFNGQYNQGIAPKANLIDLKQESSAGVKAALDWVIANHSTYNIQVVNITDFVSDVPAGVFNGTIYASEIQTIHDLGIFISTPVGNGEVQYGPNATIDYPAASPYLTAVGGVDLSGGYYADSKRGPEVSVLGPADQVTLSYYQKNPNSVGYDAYDDNYDGTPIVTQYGAGTSWASSYVAGAATLIKQVNPAFTPDQIQKILKDSGTPVLDPTNNVYYPRLNIEKAIELAKQTQVVTTPPGTLTVGANVNASKLTGSESTGQIAVNPTNANNLVIVSQSGDNNGALLPLSRSFDGGRSWTTALVGAQDGMNVGNPRPDAHVAFDSFGNLYLTYMVAATSTEIRLAVLRSSDGGQSFTSLGFAVSGSTFNPDSPWIATGVDATNPAQQDVWISFTDYNSRRVMIVGGSSNGLGQFSGWGSAKAVSQIFGTFSSVAVGPKGQLVVSWQSDDSSSKVANRLMINTDLGGTGTQFSADQLAANTNVGGLDVIPAQPERTIDAEARLAFDLSGGSTNGRLYMVYTNEILDGTNNTDIYLKFSDNFGATWSTPVRVNDDTTTHSQFLPAIAVDQTTGYVGLSWLDARNSTDNTGVQLYAAVSTDHGATVQANAKVAAGLSYQTGADPNSSDLDFGDSGGLVFTGGKLIPVWSDNSNTTGDNPNGTGRALDIYADVITVA
jgi:hypothetical protein